MHHVNDIETRKVSPKSRRAAIGGCIALAALLAAGCSSSGTTEPSGTPSRSLSEVFPRASGSFAQAGTPGAAASDEFDPSDCPPVDIRQGASTFSVNTANRDPSQSLLRYQGNFAQTARACSRSGPTMAIKLGVQGRIILGPGGGPGTLDVPLRVALVEEGVQPKTIWTKFYRVPVTIADGLPSVSFTHIVDDLIVPMPDQNTLGAYVVYIGFDPMSLVGGPKKAPPPPKPAKPRVNG